MPRIEDNSNPYCFHGMSVVLKIALTADCMVTASAPMTSNRHTFISDCDQNTAITVGQDSMSVCGKRLKRTPSFLGIKQNCDHITGQAIKQYIYKVTHFLVRLHLHINCTMELYCGHYSLMQMLVPVKEPLFLYRTLCNKSSLKFHFLKLTSFLQ